MAFGVADDGIAMPDAPVAPPVIAVQGAAVAGLGLNTAAGILGPVNRSNATIGRAAQLCLRNISGVSPRDHQAQGTDLRLLEIARPLGGSGNGAHTNA